MISKIITKNKYLFLVSLLGILLLFLPAEAVRGKFGAGMTANLSASEKASVDSLVNQYVNLLFSGDMIGLKTISTGELYWQLERLDANPGYSEFLRKHYRNAEYQVVDYRLNAQKKLMVVVKISKDDGVENHFLIHIEGSFADPGSGRQMKIEDAEGL